MRTITYSESRKNYAATLDRVANDHEEAVITRPGHEPVVMISVSDYDSLRETAYLMSSPLNARRLLASIDELETGGGTVRDLIRP
jgi:antitoxin YefM